jgi:FtsZ-interacting cell division protein ZipA
MKEWLDTALGLRVVLLSGGLLLILVLVWLERRRQSGRARALEAERAELNGEHQEIHQTSALRQEPELPVSRDSTARRPLPVIDWSALEQDSGEVDDHEARLAVHAMQPAGTPPMREQGSDTGSVTAAGAAAPSPSIDHWPPDAQRRICSLRLVPLSAERFTGRILRNALQGLGFVHGELGIFHLPDDQNRALMSAANLARPGQLDPGNMDFQNFSGLHLFMVMPGPIPAKEMLARLFAVADELAERTGGALKDERGSPLLAERRHELLEQFSDLPAP